MFSLDAFRLDERRALVTGGATGIGAAIARGLAAAGADIVVTAHARPPTEALAAIRALGRKAEARDIAARVLVRVPGSTGAKGLLEASSR